MCKIKKIFFLAIIFLLTACGDGLRISPSGLIYAVYEDNPYDYEPDATEVDEYIETVIIDIDPTVVAVNDSDVGLLRLHSRPPITLNPLLNEDVTVARVLRLIFEPLAVLDDELRVTGHLADLEFASDYSSVIATIREGAIWSDGLPVTADDVIFSVDFLRRAPRNAIYRSHVNDIASVARLDTRTVQIFFTRAAVMMGYSLNFPIIPQHVFEGEANPIGNGSFKLEAYTPMRSMTLTRNPHSSHRSNIEQIEVIFLPDTSTDFNAFERGRIDVLHLPLTEWTRHQMVRSPVYETFPAMYFEFIGFNYRRHIFRDVYTRRGIAHAFNAADTVAGVYLTHAVHSATPIHPLNWAAARGISPVYDPARAAALLGTVRTAEPLVIIANTENTQRATIAHRLAQSLNTVGLEAVAEILPSAEYFARIEAHDFDLFIGGMELPFAPDVTVFFQASEIFLHDPILETAYTALMFASTELAYTLAKRQLQQAFVEQLPVIGLAFKHSALLSNSRVSSQMSPAPCHVFGNIHEWTIR
ncbi:MAG: ABC transporter substrate-binding protein [Defluviitaleaceae bacterium]|nr:ABC transporter substrate-binding protein [Defluviitaleaceae bacterium]